MVFVLGILYLRKVDRDYDPIARRWSRWPSAAEVAPEGGRSSVSRRPPSRRSGDEPFAAINVEAVVIFAIVLVGHPRDHLLGVQAGHQRRRLLRRRPADHRRQNGLAISGDYLSAASFLGIAGLIFLYGFDGFLYSIGFLVAFLTVMFLLAERMRNAGKFTIADVLAFRLRERPARTAAAIGTLAVVAFYLIAQMVGAGVLIQALVGIDF